MGDRRSEVATTRDLAIRANIEPVDAERFIRAMVEELKLGRKVRLNGFGEFRISDLRGREIATPMLPGGKSTVPHRKAIRFRRFWRWCRQNEMVNGLRGGDGSFSAPGLISLHARRADPKPGVPQRQLLIFPYFLP